MKNAFKFFALAAAVAAFASCNEKVEAPVAKADVAPLTITAGTESRSVLRNDAEVHWISSDTLSVFDEDCTYYGFHNNLESDAAVADFLYDNWTIGKTPEFAVYCYTNGGTTRPSFNRDNGKATAILYANQRIYNLMSYSKISGLSVGEISSDGENYSVEKMKNCYSLIQFRVMNPDILSIEVKGTNNEQLGGWVDIDYSKIQPIGGDTHEDLFWTGTEGKTQSKTIKLDVAGKAGVTYGDKKVFDNSSYYYLAVLPQIVQGLSFKVKKADGTEDTQVINGPITLNRSKIKKLAHAVDSLLFVPEPEPEPEDSIILDCTDASKFVWASSDPFPTRTNKFNTEFNFWLTGQTGYEFNGNVYNWDKHLSWLSGKKIKLPNISGYSLVKMSATSQKSSNEVTYKITDGTTVLASSDKIKSTSTFPVVIDVSAHPQSSTSPDRYLTSAGEGCIKFTLRYDRVSE